MSISIMTCCSPADEESARRHAEMNAAKVGFLDPIIKVIPRFMSKDDFNNFFIRDMISETDSDFVMNLEPDSAIMNPFAFRDEFLAYDYIGAPITKKVIKSDDDDLRVGNSGFCILSRRLLEFMHDRYKYYDRKRDGNCDIFLCLKHRNEILNAGMSFAPYHVAERFSVEQDEYTGQFGCHGSFFLCEKFVSLRQLLSEQE